MANAIKPLLTSVLACMLVGVAVAPAPARANDNFAAAPSATVLVDRVEVPKIVGQAETVDLPTLRLESRESDPSLALTEATATVAGDGVWVDFVTADEQHGMIYIEAKADSSVVAFGIEGEWILSTHTTSEGETQSRGVEDSDAAASLALLGPAFSEATELVQRHELILFGTAPVLPAGKDECMAGCGFYASVGGFVVAKFFRAACQAESGGLATPLCDAGADIIGIGATGIGMYGCKKYCG